MLIASKFILVIVSISLVWGYPQQLPQEEKQPEREELEEIPKIFNTPAEIEVQPNSAPVLGEDAKFVNKDGLIRNDRSAAYTYYYPGVYYYPPKFRWNPYYYYNYYYWWL
ncbi:uncharacterized protein LOC110676147 [Aedes aegypti]|uniref:Uncharacterized protein n=1 Tax=Aedes aegypti TaxID=7159 RepID=A0A6I8TYQ6_AEDAE|nr:uncharacterized protein LOC110676147 [Aedes aegypti]